MSKQSNAPARDIRQRKPRDYWEYGWLKMKQGATVRRCHDHMPSKLRVAEATFRASRSVQKNGKPKGPWIINQWSQFGLARVTEPYAFYVEADEVDGDTIAQIQEEPCPK